MDIRSTLGLEQTEKYYNMDDFIYYADEEEMGKINDFWKGMKKSATEFGKSRGVIDGGDRWVNIYGLQSEAGKKLNGKFGLVLKKEPNDEGRYQVQVNGIRDTKLMKGSNIKDIHESELVQVYRIPANGESATRQVLLFPKIHPMNQRLWIKGFHCSNEFLKQSIVICTAQAILV